MQLSERGAFLLLSEKFETSNLWAATAFRHRDSFEFGESRGKNLEVAKFFGLKRYPMVVFMEKGEVVDVFKGEKASGDELADWIESKGGTSQKREQKERKGQKDQRRQRVLHEEQRKAAGG